MEISTLADFVGFFRLALSLRNEIGIKKWQPNKHDKKAAWAMYVEMITRVTTQRLPAEHGDEQAALDSIYSLFQTTRDVLKEHGQGCAEFTKITIAVLNQKVRPFTAKWHRKSLDGAFESYDGCAEFRAELEELQELLKNYTQALAEIAGVEDLTNLSEEQ